MEQKYKVEMNKKTVDDLYQLLSFCAQHHPFLTKGLYDLHHETSYINRKGCFKHSILMDTFRTGARETNSFCRKCEPKLYAEHKKKYPTENY